MSGKRIFFSFLLSSGSLIGSTQAPLKTIQAGNDSYNKQRYDEAAALFNKAVTANPDDSIALFNLGNTYYRLGKSDDAVKNWNTLSKKFPEPSFLSKIDYNKGVAYSRQKKLEESIDAYKRALRGNPDDNDARENLQKALLELKKKNPPRQQDKNKQQKQSSPKMNPQDVRQKLQQLEQKEKDVQQRLQKERSKTGGGALKDW